MNPMFDLQTPVPAVQNTERSHPVLLCGVPRPSKPTLTLGVNATVRTVGHASVRRMSTDQAAPLVSIKKGSKLAALPRKQRPREHAAVTRPVLQRHSPDPVCS